jgi:hypothetical protein
MATDPKQIRGTRQDTFTVGLMIEDPAKPGQWIDWGVWDTKTGGDLDSEDRLYYPGAMMPPYSLGGRISPQAITLTRNYRIQRDHYHLQKLLDGVGKSNCQVQQFAMDKYGLTHAPAIVWTGTLKTVTPPEHNSESSSDPAMISVVITVDSSPTAVGAPS